MKRAIYALLLCSSVAGATPTPMIKPPAGWTADPERAASLGLKVSALKHFGGAKVIVATEVYLPPTPGVALFVTRITSEKLVGTTAQAARFALDDFNSSSLEAYDRREGPEERTRSYVAHMEWLDTSASTQTVAQLEIVATADAVTTVRGECFAVDDAEGAGRSACTSALYTMDSGVPLDQRVAITPAPPGTELPAPALRDEPARLTDGQQVHLSPMTIAQSKPETDRRPIYLGAGIAVMAAVFWWNRRRRERFEREDQDGAPAPRRERPASRTDDDADDLAAAARDVGRDETKDES